MCDSVEQTGTGSEKVDHVIVGSLFVVGNNSNNAREFDSFNVRSRVRVEGVKCSGRSRLFRCNEGFTSFDLPAAHRCVCSISVRCDHELTRLGLHTVASSSSSSSTAAAAAAAVVEW